MELAKMADFDKAVAYVLENEGGRYEDKETGEISNFGISLAWLKGVMPEATAETIRSLTHYGAIALYRKYWWDAPKIGMIPSDRVSAKLMDTCVNCGAVTGVKILQRALNNGIHWQFTPASEDGHVGPATAARVMSLCSTGREQKLLEVFAEKLEDHYREIVLGNPEQAKNLPGWTARAAKLPKA